jgi:hypothetical protein
MNEIQLIRNQLTAERQHAGAVASACASALQRAAGDAFCANSVLGQFRQACVEYLASVLAWFEERDQRLADLAHARQEAGDSAWRALEAVLARQGTSREALEKLEAACAPASGADRDGAAQKRWQDFAQYFNRVWGARRAGLDALLASNPRVTDWRCVGGIDADSILEERQRYARVCALLPPGVTLAVVPSPGTG